MSYKDELLNFSSISELIKQKADKFPNEIAFTYRKDTFVNKTYKDVYNDVKKIAYFLNRNGYNYKHIALIGQNSYEWLISFLAIITSNNIVIPFNKDLTKEEIQQLIEKADVNYTICSETYTDKITSEYITFTDLFNCENSNYILETPNKNDLAGIFFTSGTSGDEKGVMLSHNNIVSQVKQNIDVIYTNYTLSEYERALVMLPLHHIYPIIMGVLVPFAFSWTVFINSDYTKFIQDLYEFKPNYMTSVPLFIEMMYKQVIQDVKKQNKEEELNKLLYDNSNKSLTLIERFNIFKEFLQSIGGNIHCISCGGAEMNPFYVQRFYEFGINLNYGYGATECTASITSNHDVNPNSVGKLYPNTKLQVSDKGEILINSDTVMLGYYKDEKATNQIIKNGWYHTGDIGYLDDENFLHITGRLKNLIILANGENISPEKIESELSVDKAIKEILVYGYKNILIAEIVPADGYLNNINYFNKVKKEFNKDKPLYLSIGKIVLRDKPFARNASGKIIRDTINHTLKG